MDHTIKNASEGKIIGLHLWSTCDTRHPGVAKLQTEILRVIEESKKKIKAIKLEILSLQRDILLYPEASDLRGHFAERKFLRSQIDVEQSVRHIALRDMFAEMRRLAQTQEMLVKNIIPTAGRTAIAQWITGNNTVDADLGANYGSLGDDNTAPANGDTTLGNETYRKATSSATNAANVAYLSNFYTATEVTGTFEEAGWHLDGSGSADSGELLSHFLTTTIVKTNVETLTVESELTIT